MLRNHLLFSHVFTSRRLLSVCPCKLKDYLSKASYSDSRHRHRKGSSVVKRSRSPKKHASGPTPVGVPLRPKPQKLTEQELFKPVLEEFIQEEKEANNVGEEIAGKLTKGDKTNVMRMFIMDSSIQLLASQQGLQGKMFETALQSFRQYCYKSSQLPADLHIVFKDIAENAGHVTDLFPFFLKHAKTVYPHLDCMEDLQKISDLTDPSQWYPVARSIQRKVIFHAGPTNSGKTYHALRRFMESESGVYCGPLRLLAMEVFDKCNAENVPCDLITGETRRYANDDETPAPHVACTVEMMNVQQEHEVAVIDEIQMIGDIQRGWAWTRALLGIAAQEVHVCGEETAIDLVRNLLEFTGDTFEVRRYERLTSLTYLNEPVNSFDRIRPGDCIVCFSKRDIFKVYNILSGKRHKCAVIYGDLPPGTKIMQSRKFNDPEDPCSVLVATDAVGMGLNLAIKRVIFYSLIKRTMREDNTVALEYLSTSQAQQIAGRAGRFGTQYEHGEVTTFWSKDLPLLHKIVGQEKHPLAKAGMNPTAEMIEMFSYHLPRASLSNLIDIFVHVCKMDDLYFMCNLVQFKELAEIIEHVPLPLKTRYTLCSSPLNVKKGFAQVMFVKIATQMSKGFPLTFEWLCKALGAPFTVPRSVAELEQLEGAFDVVDIYLWLSYRYPDQYVDADEVRELRVKLDAIIQAFLNRGKIAEIRRRKADISGLIEEGLVDATGTMESDIDSSLIKENPLQAYKPKPKPKKHPDMYEAFASATAEIEGYDRISADTSKSVQNRELETDVADVKSFWTEERQDTDIDSKPLSAESKLREEPKQDEGFLTKTHEQYQDLTGSYRIESMFQKKQEGHKPRRVIHHKYIDDYVEIIEDKAEDMLEREKTIKDKAAELSKPKEVRDADEEIKDKLGMQTEIGIHYDLEKDEKAKKEFVDDETARVQVKAGMAQEEVQQFQDLLTSMKKVRQKDKAAVINAKDFHDDGEMREILENHVHVYLPKNSRRREQVNITSHGGDDLRSSVSSGTMSSVQTSRRSRVTDFASSSKREVEKAESHSKVTSTEKEHFPDSTGYTAADKEGTVKFSEGMHEDRHVELEDSLTEKLVKEGVISKEMLEQLKKEWESEKLHSSERTDVKNVNGIKR